MEGDSEPLVVGVAENLRVAATGGTSMSALGSAKALIALLLIFLLVVSGPFFEYVVSPLGGGKMEPSQWGRVVQGIFLVIIFALFVYLTNLGVF